MRQPAILCIGQDRRLLRCRSQVIREIYPLVLACRAEELGNLPEQDLVLTVLCHTLSAQEHNRCVAFLRSRHPDMPIVRVTRGWFDIRDQKEIAISNKPEAMLDELRTLLGIGLPDPQATRTGSA